MRLKCGTISPPYGTAERFLRDSPVEYGMVGKYAVSHTVLMAVLVKLIFCRCNSINNHGKRYKVLLLYNQQKISSYIRDNEKDTVAKL